ncbi:C2 Calcium-Dependent Domain-Containing Protein 4C [Manis pentadactyla]|nr:C2 Calcium-Dependent Domain-Containing Protein 4C [Manis pentadactyla]
MSPGLLWPHVCTGLVVKPVASEDRSVMVRTLDTVQRRFKYLDPDKLYDGLGFISVWEEGTSYRRPHKGTATKEQTLLTSAQANSAAMTKGNKKE